MIGYHLACFGGFANAVNRLVAEAAEIPVQAVVFCIGDIGADQAFCIRSNTWNGGQGVEIKMGGVPYMLKMQNNSLCFA